MRLPPASERAVQLRAGPQLGAACLRQQQLLLEQLLIGGQDLDVAGEAGLVPCTGQVGRIQQRGDALLPMAALLGQLLNRDQRVGDLAIAVERGLLVFGQRRVESGLRRLEVPANAPGLEDRLKAAPGPATTLPRSRRGTR